MAEISLYKVTYGLTNDNKSYAGAEWYLKYETEYVSNGKTRVKWGLYKRGRTSSPSWLSTTIELYFSSDQTIAAESGSILTWTPSRISTNPNSNGSNHPHCSYNPASNTTATKSGSFVISHDAEGNGNFKVQLKAAIYTTTLSDGGVKTVALSNNKPYTACYWKDDAYVRIDETLQKPEEKITIRWSGASAGTANDIAGFEVYYSLNNGSSWSAIDTSVAKTASSTTMTVPSNRGSTITAKVVIKNTQTSFTNPSKTGGSCKINRLPEEPKSVQPSTTIIPSLGGEVFFTVEPGKDDDNFGVTVSYSLGVDGEKYKYDNNRPLAIKESTTFCFWTSDGLEYSSECVSCEIIKNSKPEIACGIKGNSFDDTIEINSASGGQSSNTYTYGFQYNSSLIKIGESTSESLYMGDIRYHLSKVLASQGGLSQNSTYEYRYWVRRNDGIENSDTWYSNPLNDLRSFTIPGFILNPGNGPSGYFGTSIEVLINNLKEGQNGVYYPLGVRDFSAIERGDGIDSLTFTRDKDSIQDFKIILEKDQCLTRTMTFDFDGLDFPAPFRPYSFSALQISMSGRGREYGFTNPANIKFKIKHRNDVGPWDIANNPSSSDNTWNLELTPSHLWDVNGIASSVANDGLASKNVELIVVNDFGEEFSKTFELSFDFVEAPTINDFKVCNGASQIKESTPITLSGTVSYYGKSLDLEVKGPLGYTATIEDQNIYITPWTWNETTGAWIANPREYDLSTITSEELGEQQFTYKTSFTIIATSDQQTTIKSSSDVTVLRHVAPRIRFTSLKYDSSADKSLSGTYVVDDYGYDGEGGQVTEVYIKNKNVENAKTYIWSSGQEGFGSFAVEYPAQSGENKDEPFEEAYRNLAPVCTVSYTLNGVTSTYSTNILEYLVVYNILPTIAYRQNYLGINTSDPEKNGQESLLNPALTISAYNNNKMVYLVSSKNSASIDLESGAMSKFVMDCGSWSNIPGGFVPGGETPSGLAAVAYTGEIGDLLQTRDDIIIITGGGAPTE